MRTDQEKAVYHFYKPDLTNIRASTFFGVISGVFISKILQDSSINLSDILYIFVLILAFLGLIQLVKLVTIDKGINNGYTIKKLKDVKKETAKNYLNSFDTEYEKSTYFIRWSGNLLLYILPILAIIIISKTNLIETAKDINSYLTDKFSISQNFLINFNNKTKKTRILLKSNIKVEDDLLLFYSKYRIDTKKRNNFQLLKVPYRINKNEYIWDIDVQTGIQNQSYYHILINPIKSESFFYTSIDGIYEDTKSPSPVTNIIIKQIKNTNPINIMISWESSISNDVVKYKFKIINKKNNIVFKESETTAKATFIEIKSIKPGEYKVNLIAIDKNENKSNVVSELFRIKNIIQKNNG